MNQGSPVRPAWAAEATLRTLWTAVGESPEWIAGRTQELLTGLAAALGIASWQTSKGGSWEGPSDTLAEIVRSFVVGGMFGDSEPENGYIFTVSGNSSRVSLQVRIAAGGISLGGRIPAHHLTVQLRELVPDGVTADMADTICAHVAQSWEPSMLTWSDPLVNRAARRGNWKIGVGYRLWISESVGTIVELADGLTSAPLAGGTIVSAPDDWAADRVVAAMTQTLAANGLDEVPH